MNTRRTLFLAALALLLLSAAVGAVAAPTGVLTLGRWVIGGGGGHSAAAPYTLDGTVGQSIVGIVAYTPHLLCSGFWCGTGVYKVYLPIVLRNY